MVVAMQSLDNNALRKAMSARGLKVTPQRMAIYGALLSAGGHPSAEEVFGTVRRVLPNVSFDTVYRTLLSFTEMGIISVQETGGKKRFDPNLAGHHHLHCIRCDRITDFHSPELDGAALPPQAGKGFQVLYRRMTVEGICAACSAKDRSANGR